MTSLSLSEDESRIIRDKIFETIDQENEALDSIVFKYDGNLGKSFSSKSEEVELSILYSLVVRGCINQIKEDLFHLKEQGRLIVLERLRYNITEPWEF